MAVKTPFLLVGWGRWLVVESLVERLVPDELWKLFRRVVPPSVVRRPQGGGRRRAGDREVLAAIVFVASTSARLRGLLADGLPAVRAMEPSAGLGPAVPRGAGRAWRQRAIGLVPVRYRLSQYPRGQGGPLTGPNPTDRGKNGSKIHLICDRSGLPISLAVSGANLHDSQALEPLVLGIPPIRSHRGPRRRRPAKLHGDKGYDYDRLRRWLRARGIVPRIARGGVESSQRLGHHRWVVERTVSWLFGCRRLHRLYERKAEHFAAFVSIAGLLIGYRRLAAGFRA